MEILARPEPNVAGAASEQITHEQPLPGGRYVDITTHTGGGHGGPAMPTTRYLLDITTGQRNKLPFGSDVPGVWLDDNYYLYTVSQGGLSSIGTWVYDRSTNSTRRLIGKSFDGGRMAYSKKKKQVWAVSQQSGISLLKLNLDGTGSTNLGTCELAPPFLLPSDDPIDLGFSNTTVDLWKAPAVDEKAIAATQPAEPPAGKIKLMEMTKDYPADQQEFAEQAYDYSQTNAMLGNYCDSIKVAMKVLAARKDQNQPVGNYFAMLKFDDCADRDRITQWAHDHTMDFAVGQSNTGDEKRAIADKVGPCVADAYFKDAKPDLNKMEMLFQQCLKEHGGTPGQPVAASNTQAHPAAHPAAGSQPPQPNNPTTQPAKQAQSNVDKAADKAKKAKNTADKIKGIFGGH
jgi:hypothetical protein